MSIDFTSDSRRKPQFGSRRARRGGFSLLEVLLTMLMAVVLMALINQAFKFYAMDMNVSNNDVQQTLIASAVLQMIEDDLRAAMHPEPVDMSAMEDALTSFSAASGGEAAAAAAVAGEDAAGMAAAGITDPVEEEMVEEEVVTTGLVLLDPGLIGNQSQIQIDVSRLPRLEEYAPIIDADTANLNDVPSDIKTVTYFVQPAETLGGIEDPLNQLDPNSQQSGAGGLVRRALDRSATVFASENGNLNQLNQTGELIAPEVLAIEFQYFDGVTWQIEWNSDDMGELPLAVRVDMTMKSPLADAAGLDSTDENALRVFTHIIRLQMAKPIEEEEEADSETSEVIGT